MVDELKEFRVAIWISEEGDGHEVLVQIKDLESECAAFSLAEIIRAELMSFEEKKHIH